MIRDKRNNRVPRPWVVLTVILLSLAMAAFANDDKKTDNKIANGEPIRVVAHLTLPGTPATQMRLQQENGREYLYLVRESGKGFTVVDVTNPKKATVVTKETLPPGSSIKNLDTVGNSMAIAESSNAAGPAQPETIRVLDLSDPANPKTVRTFNGVTSMLTEDGRRIIYLANNDGLWILRRPSKPTTHPCTSEDAISGYPECY